MLRILRLSNFFSYGKRQLSVSGTTSLDISDPEMYSIILEEKKRLRETIGLTASENLCSRAVSEANASCLTNKYSEGYPGFRYYGGTQFSDKIERICIARALEVFELDSKEWGVNVQALSGSPANLEAYASLMKPHERVMGLELTHGGHLTHGFMTAKKKISATSMFYEFMPYRLNPQTMLIDYDELEKNARLFRPRVIVAGASCYSRLIDFARFRQICDEIGAYLMVDMAHISGLVAGKVIPSPFPYAHLVTSTTHKTLRGPRGGMIFSKRGEVDLPAVVDSTVFPGFQGGPHMHIIAALAVGFKEALSPEYRDYQAQVVENSQKLAEILMSKNYRIMTGGTDNHLMLVDLRPIGLNGNRAQIACENAAIALNKNTCPYDTNPTVPGGVRIGTPVITSRGLKTQDMAQIAEFLDEVFKIGKSLSDSNKKLSQYVEAVKSSEKINDLEKRVREYITPFDLPGLPTI